MTINEYLQSSRTRTAYGVRVRAHCADGWSVSIQASDIHYCTPRVNWDVDYTHVELGFPSAPDERLCEYADIGKADMTQDVFGYVPVEVVQAIVDDHGGIV